MTSHPTAASAFKAHPWHGVSAGPNPPSLVNVYVEIVPTDTVKYEIDKETGHLMVDRPQKYSNCCPSLYGFIPRTYCGASVGAFCAAKTSRTGIRGDGDPLDICVLTEKTITHGDLLVRAVPIGGLRMIDKGEADDKIIAVLEGDAAYGQISSLAQCPAALIERLRHYFLTYKQLPTELDRRVEITDVYDVAEAHAVIKLSIADYLGEIAPRAKESS